MITMPISDYPAASTESAQMQVMSERKGEISQQLQKVQESHVDEEKKAAVTDRLSSESDSLSVSIHRKQAEKNYKEKLDSQRLLRQKNEKELLEKQAIDSSLNSKAVLDKRV
jgi:hypothetical protein